MPECVGILWNCTSVGATFPPTGCSCIAVDSPNIFTLLHVALANRHALTTQDQTDVADLVKGHSLESPYWLLAHGLLHYLGLGQDKTPARKPMWLEFGVFAGRSSNITCDAFARVGRTRARVHGFDSFEGLPTAWGRMPKGRFTLHGVMPPVRPCATLHKGLIKPDEGVWPEWLAQPQHEASSVALLGASIDVDLYAPAFAALHNLHRRGLLRAGSLLHFHEMVQPFTMADSTLYGPAADPARWQKKIAARMKPRERAVPFDEQRALVDLLRLSVGMSVWLVPLHAGQKTDAALVVVVAPGHVNHAQASVGGSASAS